MNLPLTGKVPLQVTFRNLPKSPALEAAVRRRVEHLEHFISRLTGCTVTIDSPHRHRHTCRPYVVHVRLRVPGAEIVVSQDQHGHEDPYAALQDAFDVVRRQLQDQVKGRRDARRRGAAASAAAQR